MHKLAVSVILLLGLSLPLAAQQPAAASPEATHFDFSGGLSLMRSNAPPGTCGCFTLYGASGSAALNLNSWLGIVGDVGYVRDSSITSSDRSLSILSYLVGPRFSLRTRRRITPFAQVLFGDARGSGTLLSGATTPVTDNAFALTVGGGLDYALTRRWSVRGQVEYMQTRFPNEVNNRENNLRISFGAVYHLGGPTSQDRHHHWWWP
ncbi:MAG TPA: outer membrane beta-barrel protein [Candidatus Acidoferrales bacterium]|nr:outer membrane beta-barrel protein [Candidatus Acidoferrales bacterium]